LNRSRHLDRGFDLYDDRAATEEPGGSATVGQRARAWAATAREPWFVWVHFAEPHGPFETDDPALYRAAYGEAVRRLDRQLSQLIAVLDSDASPPGILLTALHGQGLGDVDRTLGHGRFVEWAQIRVPLIWRSPRAGGGTGVGRRIHKPVSLLDVAPTLLEAGGFPPPVSFEGSVLPHSDPATVEVDPRVFFAEGPGAIAVIDGFDFALLPRVTVSTSDRRDVAPPREQWFRMESPSERAHGSSDPPAASPPLDATRLRLDVLKLPRDWRRPAAADGASS
jgi:hypothetical protein